WFKKFGLHMDDRMTLNAYKLYKNTRVNNYKKTFMEFNKQVASQLLKKYNSGAKTIIEKSEKFIKDRHDARLAIKQARQQAERAAAGADQAGEKSEKFIKDRHNARLAIKQARQQAERAAAGADQAGRGDPLPPVARPAPGGSSSEERPSDLAIHQLSIKPPTDKKNKPRVRCRECFLKDIRKETRKICKACKDDPGLCSPACFEAFHARKWSD
ncbi:unnamed protein product, partial [Meganyctiphanes norvegica]